MSRFILGDWQVMKTQEQKEENTGKRQMQI